jgi:hypothetical protein
VARSDDPQQPGLDRASPYPQRQAAECQGSYVLPWKRSIGEGRIYRTLRAWHVQFSGDYANHSKGLAVLGAEFIGSAPARSNSRVDAVAPASELI